MLDSGWLEVYPCIFDITADFDVTGSLSLCLWCDRRFIPVFFTLQKVYPSVFDVTESLSLCLWSDRKFIPVFDVTGGLSLCLWCYSCRRGVGQRETRAAGEAVHAGVDSAAEASGGDQRGLSHAQKRSCSVSWFLSDSCIAWDESMYAVKILHGILCHQHVTIIFQCLCNVDLLL